MSKTFRPNQGHDLAQHIVSLGSDVLIIQQATGAELYVPPGTTAQGIESLVTTSFSDTTSELLITFTAPPSKKTRG